MKLTQQAKIILQDGVIGIKGNILLQREVDDSTPISIDYELNVIDTNGKKLVYLTFTIESNDNTKLDSIRVAIEKKQNQDNWL